MVVDTSAIIAILFEEPEMDRFEQLIAGTPDVLMSAASHLEAGVVVLGRHGPSYLARVELALQRFGITVVPVTPEQAILAIAAYERFGKGRHPAGLNYGDCFSYALAKARGEPLLAKGDDFTRTDAVMAA